jgi:2-amino-4-hydroxy-6-hydroxymethyldihydropteridine diphosphokinase
MSDIAYLSLGSNVGDRDKNLCEAIRRLSALGRVTSVSSFYETEPVEFTNQAWFLNCAVALEVSLKPGELMRALLQTEQEMGRERIQKKGPRLIDLDIMLFGNTVVNTAELVIPHPAMARRRFVLEPLAEIAPELRHPLLNKSVRQILDELPAGQKVTKL